MADGYVSGQWSKLRGKSTDMRYYAGVWSEHKVFICK